LFEFIRQSSFHARSNEQHLEDEDDDEYEND
jgi:hypothetical protein